MLFGRENPHGGRSCDPEIALDFSANTNPFGTPQRVKDAMAQALERVHQYPDPYCAALCSAIAQKEAVEQDFVLCGNGAAELIYSYCEALHPACAVETAPTFSEYAAGLARVGCRVERYLLKRENDFALGEDFLDFLQEKQPEAIFLCNPNNPTGKTVERALLLRVLDFCRASGCALFVDECFLDFTENGSSLKDVLWENPALVILKAFTKSYGLAGVRLGYVLSSNYELLQRMSETVPPWNVSTLAQAAGVAALRETDFLKKTKQVISKERGYLAEALRVLGLWVCEGEANYLLFAGPVGLDTALRAQHIAVRSCANYEGLGAGWYRTAVRLHEENCALVEGIEKVLKEETAWQKTL